MSSRKDFDGFQKKRVSKGRRRTGFGGVIKKSIVLFVVVFVVLKVSFFLKKFTFSTTRRSDHDTKKKEKDDNVLPPRRALATESSSDSNNRARDLGINAFRLNTFNLDETFPRRFISPKTSNETSSVGEAEEEEKEEEGEEESQQFLAKLLDAFMKQNSALYDAKMKALGGVRSSLDDDDDDAFVSSSFPLQRLRRVDACEPRCEGEFRRTGGFGLLPQFFAKVADPNWDSLENRLNATRENAREFFAHFAEFYVQDEDEEDEAMKTALKIFNGLVTAKDDRLLYNGMNSNNNNVILRVLAGEERDVIRKAMLMGKEMS
ncbi:unnamed protein product [Bathycoccus prasinos]